MQRLHCLVIVAITLGACATVPAARDAIRRGEKVRVNYTCRLGTGAIAATTLESIAQDTSLAKADLFAPHLPFGPAILTAGEWQPPGADRPFALGFDDALTAALSERVVGLRPGVVQGVDISAPGQGDLPHDERYIDMARVRRRPKEVTITLPTYRARVGGEPEVGKEVTLKAGVVAMVAGVTDGQVTLQFQAPPGTEVATPFGLAKVRDAGDHFDIELQVQEGRLVRVGPLVGRIVKVTDTNFTLDFGNPFGGEVLHCEVRPERDPVVVGKVGETREAPHE